MGTIIIIADDLTGACDSGIKLLKKGYKTEVIINADTYEVEADQTNLVVSVNTESRGLQPSDAYDKVFQATKKIAQAGINKFYKKIDSVLRGNIGVEIDAMLDASGYTLAIVASALPVNGRKIINGNLHVVSTGASSAIYPVAVNIAKGSKKKIGSVYLSTVRSGSAQIIEEIKILVGLGNAIIVFDSETDEDLERIAVALAQLDIEFLPVGTAGLINYLDRFWMKNRNSVAESIPQMKNLDVLVVVGTMHPTTSEQVSKLIERPDVYNVYINVDDFTKDKAASEKVLVLKKLQEDIREIANKKSVILTTSTVIENNLTSHVHNNDIHNQLISDTISELASDIIDILSFNKIIVTGGDTASNLLNRLGAVKIDLVDEPMPGIVTGYITDNKLDLLVSTKSGGFGDSKTLVNLLDYMSQYN